MAKVNIIGAGFSGLSAACYLAKAGHEVHIYEKHDSIGGRARQFKAEGFTFDMGPSWYWMPDIFEKFYNDFGKTASDFYELKRLTPSYQIFYRKEQIQIPASISEIYDLFESIEVGSAAKLKRFLDSARYKYEVGINEFVEKPSLSLSEFLDFRIVSSAVKLNMLSSLSKEVRSLFKDSRLIELLEFPVLFLGATPQKIPAMYSLMNYADLCLGTWYPIGGMHEIIRAIHSIAIENGVWIHLNSPVDKIVTNRAQVESLLINDEHIEGDICISSADYHHTDQQLLKRGDQNYSENYWDNRVMAPSSLLFYMGTDKKMTQLHHHNLFFDEDFGLHAKEIYESPSWPSKPLFYVCCPSITDPSVAPSGHENLFLLMPLAPGIEDSVDMREKYFNIMIDRFERRTGNQIKEHIIYKKSYCIDNFKEDYNAFKGNAYGLANTLSQTAFLKPRLKSKRLQNMYYTGQLTVPGPGVPPSLISGRVVARQVLADIT